MTIIVATDPIPAARPRFGGHAYQPKRNREYRAVVQQSARAVMKGQQPMTGEITCRVKLYRKFKPTARNFGDVDNHAKAILDGLSKIVYRDDSQVVSCLVEKHTDKNFPRAEIELTEIRKE